MLFPTYLLDMKTIAGLVNLDCDPVFEDCTESSPCDPVFEDCKKNEADECDPVFEDCKTESSITWREDLRCGPNNPLEDGTPATCNPNINFCCSALGWCGESAEKCTCSSCVDYRTYIPGDILEVYNLQYTASLSELLRG